MSTEVLPLTKLPVHGVPARALAVGAPDRAERAAELLEEARPFASNREYVSYAGRYKGQEITVISHGVGSAGAAVCFEELCRAGARRIVRAGTAGGMQAEIASGSAVIASAAVRDEGTTPRLVPLAYPAVCDPELVIALRRALPDAASGVVLSSDLFYPSRVLGSELELWQRAGCAAVEMELSALLVTAAQHGARAAGVFAVDGNPLAAGDAEMADYRPDRAEVSGAVDAVLRGALEALTADG
ncbi:nucleoside phosphorylase [Streptomyces sp. ODS28]|uniref:nucleoside phosphorylase n=1 Tax=Streptomyces sp. ODS28 TaxID=3136688 RepID=UPI0031EAE263